MTLLYDVRHCDTAIESNKLTTVYVYSKTRA